jgi:isoaspartyl peptidase/L-asparaginase-like protein (Ntn-hydrolase superfamily)
MNLPIILSTWSFGAIANRAGWARLSTGSSAIDAVEAGCIAVEDDETVDSVGRGGLPDARGDVSLDGCVMLSPAKSAGVANVRKYGNPVSIARNVMERTPHKLLVGEGAESFAEACGFPQVQLLTEPAKRKWEVWTRTRREERERATSEAQGANREDRREAPHDTVGVLAIDQKGTIAGACSTSGLPFKLPGRVGDSPILGHGLFVEPTVGAAVATGNGELMMGISASFLCVEFMRGGKSPMQAVQGVLRRIADSYQVQDRQQCGLIALLPSGEWACGSLREGFRVPVMDKAGERMVESQFLLLKHD